MRRKRLPPDDRLDWRDPDMPAYEDGLHSPEKIQRMAERRLAGAYGPTASRHFPNWDKDPSYNWSKKK